MECYCSLEKGLISFVPSNLKESHQVIPEKSKIQKRVSYDALFVKLTYGKDVFHILVYKQQFTYICI